MPLPMPRPLQATAQRGYLWMTLLNPIGANLTIGPVCTLLALHYGSSDLQMSLLYAGIYLTGLCAVIAPAFLAGADATRIAARSWWIRAFIGGLLLFLPLVPWVAKSWLLLGVVYVFLAVRAVGVATLPLMLRAIAGRGQLQTLNARGFVRWHLGCLVTSVVALAVFSQRDVLGEEPAYMLLLAIGFVFNLAASAAFSGIPDTGSLEGSSMRGLGAAVLLVARTRSYREVVFATALQVPMAVASAFQINHLDKELHLGPTVITALTFASILAAAAGARSLVMIGTRIPLRALMVGSHIGLALLGAAWTWLSLVPAAWQSAVGSGLFVTSTLFLSTSGTLLSSMGSERLPERDAVSVSVIYQLVGAFAALAGIGAVALLALLPWAQWPGLHHYSHAFALWTVLSLGVCLLGLAMADGKLATLADDLEQLRPSNLMTVFRSHRMQVRASSEPGEVHDFEEMLTIPVPATAGLLLQSLRSPEVRGRTAAYRALYERPLPEALPMVLAEAANTDSPLRLDAITALGFLRLPAALPALRELAADRDPLVAAAAWKGLMRHGEPFDADAVLRCYRGCVSAKARNDLLYGLLAVRRTDLLLAALGFEIERGSDAVMLRGVLVIIAESLGDTQRMTELLARERDDPAAAIAELLAELPDQLAGAPRAAWVEALAGRGLPPGATLPGGLAPTSAVALIGLLHCARLIAERESSGPVGL